MLITMSGTTPEQQDDGDRGPQTEVTEQERFSEEESGDHLRVGRGRR